MVTVTTRPAARPLPTTAAADVPGATTGAAPAPTRHVSTICSYICALSPVPQRPCQEKTTPSTLQVLPSIVLIRVHFGPNCRSLLALPRGLRFDRTVSNCSLI